MSVAAVPSGSPIPLEPIGHPAPVTAAPATALPPSLSTESVTTLHGDELAKKVTPPASLRTRDFGFLPIPRRLQWEESAPPSFSLLTNVVFGFASTFTVASLYYVQPILIVLATKFNVDYSTVANLPTLLQGGYATGLLLITPLGDLIRRRELLLLLVSCGAVLTIILPFVPLSGFSVICYFLGAASVTPQILLPLAADLAPPHKRASALSIVLAGLLFGILFARVLAGVVAQQTSVDVVWYISFGLQLLILGMLWGMVPDYPAKNSHLTYRHILASMATYAVTEPVLVQSCLIGGVSSAVFSSFWVSSTFLLGEVYLYSSLEIGLYALIGIVGVSLAPFIGKAIDKLVPWVGVLIGISIVGLSQVVYTATAGVSVGGVVVVIFLLDIGQQTQQVSNSTRIFAVNAAARARFSAVYIFSIFCGQLIGTAGGTRVYLAGGYHASGGLCLGFVLWMFLVLFSRGPHLPSDRWFGYAGGWDLNKVRSDQKKEELRLKEVELEGTRGEKVV